MFGPSARRDDKLVCEIDLLILTTNRLNFAIYNIELFNWTMFNKFNFRVLF